MENKVQIYSHSVFGDLPILIIDGVEWFGATESAKSLSFSNPYAAISNHIDSEDLTDHEVLTPGGTQNKKFTNESGLYALIFGAAKQGNNPEIKEKAKLYKRWITKDILPSIRKTGRYDDTENRIMAISDEKLKGLELKLYKLQQLLQVDPYDQLVQIQYKDAETKLGLYRQEKETKVIQAKMVELTQVVEKVQQDNELIHAQQLFVCNRTNFNDKVKILANKYFGRNTEQAYGEIYATMKTLGSFDVYARRKNGRERINEERVRVGKKPLKESSLNSKYGCLDVIDAFDKWELASEAYKTIEIRMIKAEKNNGDNV